MKQFTRIEPTTVTEYGDHFKRAGVVKHFRTEDGLLHEFTTMGYEGGRVGGVIALTPDNKVITARQFRPGPEKHMYEVPSGGMYAGEDPQAAAMRELLEETGYESSEVTLLGINSRGGYDNNLWYYYLARNCQQSATGPQFDKEEADQGIDVVLLSIDEFLQRAKQNEVSDIAAVLLAYDILKEMA